MRKTFEELKQEREGMISYNKKGLRMKLLEYYGVRKVLVEFDDGFQKYTAYKEFIKGSVKNDNYPTVFGVGFSIGKYSPKEYEKEYRAWSSMLYRCYSKKYKQEHPTYANAKICDEWLYFSNFCEWAISQENYDVLKGTQWAPDKDILIKGNKIYSPQTVCLVPQNVNKLLLKHDNAHGDLPIGVTHNYAENKCKYMARCNNPLGKNWYGYFNDVEEAFMAYKNKKEEIIKIVANHEYAQGTISTACYRALMEYEVEITD